MPGAVGLTLPRTPSSAAVVMLPDGSPVLLQGNPPDSQPVNAVTLFFVDVGPVISPVAVPPVQEIFDLLVLPSRKAAPSVPEIFCDATLLPISATP